MTLSEFEESTVAHMQVDPPLAILDRICETAAVSCGCECAVIAYNRGNRTRIIASHGITARFRIYEFEMSVAPFDPAGIVVKTGTASDPFYSRLGVALGIPVCAAFFRIPISITPLHAVSLILLSAADVKKPTKAKLNLLKDAAKLAGDHIGPYFPLLDDDDARVSAVTDLPAILAEIAASEEMAALIDEKLVICAMSRSMAGLIGGPAGQAGRTKVNSVGLHAGDAIDFFFQQALESGLSPPEFEIVTRERDGSSRVFAVMVSPLSPTDSNDRFLYVVVRDVTSLSRREAKLSNRLRRGAQKAGVFEEPSLRFLLDTLVRRRTLRERKGAGYMTLDSWRQPVRSYQIAALKALKQKVPLELGHAAAERIIEDVDRFVGMSAFRCVVPVPCSNSHPDSCLSLEIARAIGARCGIPVVQCLHAPPFGGSSHPKKNVRRPRMTLTEKITGPVLLVDDVATSGAHIEEAVKLLKPACGAVMAVAWIGNTVA